MSESPTRAPERFDALDTLRCLAVLVMVQGHSFYVTLTHAERASPWHSWHDYLHGYTAPAFLFGAGLAFGFTTLSHKIGRHAVWGPTLRRRLYRYASLFAIGYAIQLPPMGIHAGTWSESSIRIFLRVEALQHIGAALMFCQLLVVLMRRWWAVASATALLAAAIVLLGPAASRMSAEALGPRAVSAYWTSEMGSTFPLVPWSGFVFAGATAGALLTRARQRFSTSWIVAGFVGVGVMLVFVSLGFDHALPGLFGPHPYWKVNPYFFLRRLGWVLCALGVMAGVDCLLVPYGRKPGAIRRWIRVISQQSLVVYVAHLVILYGSPLNRGLRSFLWRKLDWMDSSLVALGLFVAMGLLLVAWQAVDERFPRPFFHVRRAGVALMALVTVFVGVQASGMVFDAAPRRASARPNPEADTTVPVSTVPGRNRGRVQPVEAETSQSEQSGARPLTREPAASQRPEPPPTSALPVSMGPASAALTWARP